MQQFSALVFDRRYAVPTLRLGIDCAEGEEDQTARRLLEESPFHDVVELRDGDRLAARAVRVQTSRPGFGPHDQRLSRWA
jgi:hypothetical protein